MLYATQYQPIDVRITSGCAFENPFLAQLYGRFQDPEGKVYEVPGFYDGNGVFIIRACLPIPGRWTYTVQSADIPDAHVSGEIDCRPNENPRIHGRLGIDAKNRRHFSYEDGTDCFMMAYECDWLWALGLGDEKAEKIRELADIISSVGFNQVIVNVYAHDTAWAPGKSCEKDYGPPAMFAWEGSNEKPDHSRMNTAFFQNYDRMMRILLERGIDAHIFLKVYNKEVNWPKKRSWQEALYLRYLAARYQGFPNVIWDFSKEAYYETDKDYIYDTLKSLRNLDAYKHLITLHDDRIFYNTPAHARVLDFETTQQHDELYASNLLIHKDRDWPVFNSEFGYEVGPGGKDSYLTWTGHTGEELVGRAWEVVMSGAYIAYYYDYTAWDIVDYSHTPGGYAHFKRLKAFMQTIPWKEFRPAPEICCWSGKRLCLLQEGRRILVYADKHVLLTEKLVEKKLKVQWMHTLTGETVEGNESLLEASPHSSGLSFFKNPFGAAPAVLLITIDNSFQALET